MALLLRDAGMEVIYTGIRNSIDAIVHTALQEDVQIIGLSTLSGAHLGWSQQLLERLREQGMEDVKVVVGGVIPEADIPVLKALGVVAVFPGGTPFADVVATIEARWVLPTANGPPPNWGEILSRTQYPASLAGSVAVRSTQPHVPPR